MNNKSKLLQNMMPSELVTELENIILLCMALIFKTFKAENFSILYFIIMYSAWSILSKKKRKFDGHVITFMLYC